MLKATALIAGSVLLGTASFAVAEPPQQFAQAQTQSPSQLEQDYQNRLRAAKTPEERARIQAEHDRMMQQGAVPGSDVQSAPGTAGSGTMPTPPGSDSGTTRAGESPSGGGAVPRGQGGGGSSGN